MNRRDLMKQSSMEIWYPALESFEEVNTPETKKIPIEEKFSAPESEIVEAMKDLGTPVFMRTDAASNKHRMEKASKIQERDKELIEERYRKLIEFNMSQMLPFNCLYLREWLDLRHRFKAFGGTPIAEELRFFIHNGEILDYHFYWPEESIIVQDPEKASNWELDWLKTKKDALENREEAVRQAGIVAEKFRGQGFWSVDFARTESGEWYAIDMAKGEVSWMPDKPEPTVKVDRYEEEFCRNDISERIQKVRERIEEVESE